MPSTSRRLLTAVLAGSYAAAFGAAMYAMTSESVLRATFASALDHRHTVSKPADVTGPISGSEDFWLNSHAQLTGNSAAKKVVSVGDTISLDLGGEKRTLQVSKISEYMPQVTEIDTSTQPSKFVMVTARDVSDPNSRPIRLVIELEQPSATINASRSGRTL